MNNQFLKKAQEKIDDGKKNLNTSVYLDGVIDLAITTYYQLQITNINSALDRLEESGLHLTSLDEYIEKYARATLIKDSVIENINERIEEITAMSLEEKSNLMSKTSLKNISADIIKSTESYLTDKKMSDNVYPDLYKDLKRELENTPPNQNINNALNFMEFTKHIDSDFRKTNAKYVKEVDRLTAYENNQPEQSNTLVNKIRNKLKI